MYKIGFRTETNKNKQNDSTVVRKNTESARKSLVDVYFPDRHLTCSYYNDKFDLKLGDIVYVDGKLEGLRGRVTDINYTFKIKLSDYKRVISVADTDVTGEIFMAGSHFIANKPDVLPFEKVITWFKAPSENEEFVSSTDNEKFLLEDLKGLKISNSTADLGHDYYMENRVVYIEIKDGNVRAIVNGGKPYEVEFNYRNGEISGLVCNCYCTGTCKHEFAVLLQLRETLDIISKEYGDNFYTDYLAVINKGIFFEFVIDNKSNGSFKLT